MTSAIEVPPTHRVSADVLRSMLDDARRRTRELTRDLSGDRLLGPELSIVNPPLWELGHVGFFHDHFALRLLYGLPGYQRGDAERLYDSSSIEHDRRWRLPLPPLAETLDYLERVRRAMLERLPDGLASEAQSYVYQLTTLHEDMHGEAFAYTRQTLGDPPPELAGPDGPAAAQPGGAEAGAGGGPLPGDVEVAATRHLLGSDERVPFRFDNEKEAHEVELAPFAIARAPVTNAEFAAFVEAGGYERAELWSEAGWRWREARGLMAPVYWRRDGAGGWCMRWFDRWLALAPHRPVSHVSWFEADAYCRWAGRRLPSEAEWEVAASRVPEAGGTALAPGKRRFPWGESPPTPMRANLDGYRLGCLDVGALPEGDSALGCRQMIGNLWEWTDSVFAPFPGFRPDLYRDYSEPWFPEGRRVLRGGAWATRARLIHNGHRNFFTPERNDIFAGFRTCAR